MIYHDPAVRQAYIAGARQAVDAAVIHLPATTVRELMDRLLPLDARQHPCLPHQIHHLLFG